MPRITNDEKRWRAEMDATTLAEARAIKDDPRRLNEAKNVARSMAKDAQSRANELKSISRERRSSTPQEKKQASDNARKRARAKQRKPRSKPVNPLLKGL